MAISVGDIVTRKSYKCDVFFRIIRIDEANNIAELTGEDLRLYADAPLSDLVQVTEREQENYTKRQMKLEDDSNRLFRQDYQMLRAKREYTSTNGYREQTSFFEIPGRVLHIDGDPYYLKKCLRVYEKLGVPVLGKYVKEDEMPDTVPELVRHVRPDILVLTGHDAYMKNKGPEDELKAYRHSGHFIRTVKEVRYLIPHLDQLVIFAGACQSHFELLIRAGANFASSPTRINIHALDPVYLVSKISFTSFMDSVNVWDVLRNTLSGAEGMGGVETKGILRTGMPYNKP
ncbi:spore coat assembly protein [Pullulanibacillus pueri]|uniref:Sporulation peptidase YabG n=1 Tax=Pullulanibacillus pueri TaxID=1437324 RepID=A0A8J3A031_9BACL|nr:sporulation peptidase YabG [Pullulanibacillus pueri]MBM7684000.1 spore coat assembly protein [Pullulanibacillus pueri]GGH88331.1 sporulation peptidase YabG [Pullulanibacillus pueri]